MTSDQGLFDRDNYLRAVDPFRPESTELIDNLSARRRTALMIASLAAAERDESDVVTPRHVRRAEAYTSESTGPSSVRADVGLALGTLLAGAGLTTTIGLLTASTRPTGLIATAFALLASGFLIAGISVGALFAKTGLRSRDTQRAKPTRHGRRVSVRVISHDLGR